MTLETKTALCQETKDCLQELIQMNIDSRDGYQYAAKQTQDLTLISLFQQMAAERQAQADDLAAALTINAEKPCREGSYAAAMHRSWIAVREAFTNQNEYVVLCEAERGEDAIKNGYEQTLKNHPGTAMNDVLQKHFEQVRIAHDRIRDMRDERKE